MGVLDGQWGMECGWINHFISLPFHIKVHLWPYQKKEFKANNGKKKGKRPLTAVDVVEETIADDWFVYSERWPPLLMMDFQMNGQGRNMPERG